ncbi:hypothetical protein FA13DRAFT_1808186, partial [Coprinellus micaceus]
RPALPSPPRHRGPIIGSLVRPSPHLSFPGSIRRRNTGVYVLGGLQACQLALSLAPYPPFLPDAHNRIRSSITANGGSVRHAQDAVRYTGWLSISSSLRSSYSEFYLWCLWRKETYPGEYSSGPRRS